MKKETIANILKKRIPKHFKIYPAGKDKYIISTPFTQCYGEYISIVLKKENGEWYLTSDKNIRFMFLGFEELGMRKQFTKKVKSSYGFIKKSDCFRTSIKKNNCVETFYRFILGLIETAGTLPSTDGLVVQPVDSKKLESLRRKTDKIEKKIEGEKERLYDLHEKIDAIIEHGRLRYRYISRIPKD